MTLSRRLNTPRRSTPQTVTSTDLTNAVVEQMVRSLVQSLMQRDEAEFRKRFSELEKELFGAGKELVTTATKLKQKIDADIAAHIKSKEVLVKGAKGDKGDKGDSIVGPKGDNGKDGKDAPMPSVDSLVSSVLAELKKGEKPEKTLSIADIKDLAETLKVIRMEISRQNRKGGGGGGGGMGNAVTQTTALTSGTTTITLTSRVASNGKAIWFNYQGQQQAYGTHFTVSGNTITLLFTPDDNTFADIIYIRT